MRLILIWTMLSICSGAMRDTSGKPGRVTYCSSPYYQGIADKFGNQYEFNREINCFEWVGYEEPLMKFRLFQSHERAPGIFLHADRILNRYFCSHSSLGVDDDRKISENIQRWLVEKETCSSDSSDMSEDLELHKPLQITTYEEEL